MGFNMKCVTVLDRMPCICCSCELKVATCVIGWLYLVLEAGSVLINAVDLAMTAESGMKFPQGTTDGEILQLVLSTIGILLVSLLLYGAHNEKPGFMLPFIIVAMMFIAMMAVAVPITSITLFFFSFVAGISVLLVGGLLVVLYSFFWVVIYSYYRKLEEQWYQYQAASLDNFVNEEKVTMQIGHTEPDSRVEAGII